MEIGMTAMNNHSSCNEFLPRFRGIGPQIRNYTAEYVNLVKTNGTWNEYFSFHESIAERRSIESVQKST